MYPTYTTSRQLFHGDARRQTGTNRPKRPSDVQLAHCHVSQSNQMRGAFPGARRKRAVQSMAYLQMSDRAESKGLLKFQGGCAAVPNEERKESVALAVQQPNQLPDFPAAGSPQVTAA